MCGIAGKVHNEPGRTPDESMLQRMARCMVHRGPDDEGTLISGQAGFAFRRLSIIDLAGGHQPMPNDDGSVWIAFNGEIYNYRQLRESLVAKGRRFRTSSDTEVIIRLYEEYGDGFVDHLTGMFAIALWDVRRRRLVLARDRTGIKPLYYALGPDGITFGSEVKAVLEDPEVRRELDVAAIDRFLTFYYLPGPDTLLKAVDKLPPGHILTYEDGAATIRQYWDLKMDPARSNSMASDRVRLLELLETVVEDHLVADVPVGLLLSGGVDSTAVLSLASGLGAELSTFTIGFSDESFADERPFARLAAERFHTNHYEASMSGDDFLGALPRYVWHMEEPICEPPAIALYFVAKLAAEHVKVVLSGEGGDEAFAGYPNHRNHTWYERVKRAAGPTRPLVARLLERVPDQGPRIDKYLRNFNTPLPDYYLSRTSTPSMHFNRIKGELYTADLKSAIHQSSDPLADLWANVADQPALNQMLYVDTKTWLPDDLLVKADKMTMATSLELRVPLLDHRVLEFAASLPLSRKLRGLQTKHLLKSALEAHVPKEIRDRKKTGFPVPYQRWVAEAATGSIADLLLDGAALGRGYFQQREVERLLQRCRSESALSREVFSLVVLELWHRLFIDGAGQPELSLARAG